MAKPKRFSPTDRRSWRANAASPEAVNAARRQKRIFVTGCGTLLTGLLVALLVYILWPTPRLRVAGLVIDELVSYASPPIAFAGEDQAALKELCQFSRNSFVPLPCQQSDSFSLLPNQLAKLAHSRDVAVVYVAAHGASLEGKPVILCSDYDPRDSSVGRYAFTDLLTSLKSCHAKTCLLVLDTGRLDVDISGGMLVNQFPELVKAEVSKLVDAPHLWVILANSFLEQSLVSRADRRSAFNFYFCNALRGDADKPGHGDSDMDVELNELVSYLEQVSTWATNSSGGVLSQNPVVLQGGKGVVTTIPEIYLARSQPPRKPPEKTNQTSQSGAGATGAITGVAAALLSPAALFVQPSNQDAPPAAVTPSPAAAGSQQSSKSDGVPPATSDAPMTPPPAADAKASANAAAPSAPASPTDSKADPNAAAPSKSSAEGTATKAPPVLDAKSAPQPPEREAAEATSKTPPDPLDKLRRDFETQRMRAETADDRSTPNDWIPADYAPHLWHALGDRLADCQARLDAGVNFTTGEAQSRTSRRIADLEQFWTEIERRHREFSDEKIGQARADYERYPNIRTAIQARNELFNRLPRYIRFYTSAAVHSSAPDFGENLRAACDRLREFRDLLELPIADPKAVPEEANQLAWQSKVEQWLTTVGSRGVKLAAIQKELDDYIVNAAQEIVARSQALGAVKRQVAETSRLQALLDSQLLGGPTRERVFEALRRLDKPFDQVATWTSVTTENDGWQRAAHRAELELNLVELVPESPPGITKATAAASADRVPKRVPTAPNDIKKQCTIYTELGAALAKSYAQLPRAIDANSQKGNSFPHLRHAEIQIHLVRGRDGEVVDKLLTTPRVNLLAQLGIPVIRPKPSLTATPQVNGIGADNSPQLRLVDANQFETLTFVVQATTQLPKELWATLNFDERRLAVTYHEGRTLRSNVKFDAGSTGGTSTDFTLKVKALDTNAPPPKLSVRFDGGELNHESSVEVVAPKPTRLELVIDGDSPKTWSLPGTTKIPTVTHGALRPFPNAWVDGKPKGGTNYSISVRDSGGRGRDLKYRLVALPKEKGDLPRTTLFPWDGRQRLPVDCKVLVPEEDFKLPPNKSIPLPFAPTAVAAAAAASPPPPPPAENAPPPEPGTPIEGGLVAIFRDPANSTEEWIWLEVDVLHPDGYLSEPVVSYDGETQRIDISVKAQEPAGLPSDGTEITLQLPAELTGKKALRGVLQPERADRAANLFVQVPPQRNLLVPVSLDVDGYPRAFIYDVECIGGKGIVPRKVRNFATLEIVQPDDRALFGAIPKLPVHLLVDFPPRDETEAAFACRLLVNDAQEAEFFHDRRRRVWLLKPQAPGEITLQTSVDDLQADVKTVEFRNDEVTITSELWTADLDGTNEDRIERVQRMVRIDAVNPDIRALDDGRLEFRGEQEKPLLIRFRVIDTNPIKKVEVAFGQVDGVLKDPVEAGQVGTDEYEAAIPTAGKRAGGYKLYAQATDNADNACPTKEMYAVLVPPPPPGPDNKPAGMTNDMNGVLEVGGQGARNIKVTLTGKKSASTTSGQDGSFQFKDLPAGDYKLTAKGYFKNSEYSAGPIDVKVEPPPAPPTTVDPITLAK